MVYPSGPPAIKTEQKSNPRGRLIKSPQSLTEMLHASAIWRQPYETRWQACWDWYRGATGDFGFAAVYDDLSAASRRVSVNIIKPLVDTLTAATSTRDAKFALVPRSATAARNVDTAEAVLNYFWRSRQMQHAFTLAQTSNIVIGHGWVNVNWKLDMETRPPTADEREQRFNARRLEVEQFRVDNPQLADDTISDAELRRIVNEEIDAEPPLLVSHSEYPLTRYPSPWDMFVDPKATGLHDADWICERVFLHKDQIVGNQNYNRTARREVRDGAGAVNTQLHGTGIVAALTSTERGQSRISESGRQAKFPHTHLVETFVFHDLREGTWLRFVPNTSRFLTPETESPYKNTPHRSPYEMLRNHEVVDFYPQGDVEQIIPLNWEVNETRTLLMNTRRGLTPKVLARRDALTPEARQQFESVRPNTVVEIGADQRGTPLNDIALPFQPPRPDPNMYDLFGVSMRDAQMVSGVSDIQQGVAQVERRSATEAGILSQAGNNRVGKKIYDAQQAAARIGARVLMLCQQYLSREDVVRITDEKGAQRWQVFDSRHIQGQYDFDVEHGSMMPEDDQARRQDTLALIQGLTALGALAGGPVDVSKLAELVLRRFGVRNIEDYLLGDEQQLQTGQMQAAAGMGAGPGMGTSGIDNNLMTG